jgi:PTS system sucrose-specific IIC component
LLGYGSGLVVAYVVGFVATMFFGVSDSVRADLEAQSAASPGDPVAPDAPLDVPIAAASVTSR